MVCTVTEDVALVNKIKSITEQTSRVESKVSHDHHKNEIYLLLLEGLQCCNYHGYLRLANNNYDVQCLVA